MTFDVAQFTGADYRTLGDYRKWLKAMADRVKSFEVVSTAIAMSEHRQIDIVVTYKHEQSTEI